MGAITTPGYLLTVGLLYPESQGTALYLSGDELVTYRGILLYCSKVGHIVGKSKNILTSFKKIRLQKNIWIS